MEYLFIHFLLPLPKTYDFPLGIRLTQFFVTYSIPIPVLSSLKFVTLLFCILYFPKLSFLWPLHHTFGHENFQSLKCLIFPQLHFLPFSSGTVNVWSTLLCVSFHYGSFELTNHTIIFAGPRFFDGRSSAVIVILTCYLCPSRYFNFFCHVRMRQFFICIFSVWSYQMYLELAVLDCLLTNFSLVEVHSSNLIISPATLSCWHSLHAWVTFLVMFYRVHHTYVGMWYFLFLWGYMYLSVTSFSSREVSRRIRKKKY